MISFEGDIVIVAGAGKGIGFSIINRLINDYPELEVLAISRNCSQLFPLKISNNKLQIASMDLSELTLENKEELISIIGDKKIRGLIFTAGYLEKEEFGKINLDLFNKIYKTNVWSFIDLVQTLKNNLYSKSHIVSIGSMGGFTGTLKFPGMLVYSSSKAALANVTECMAEELKNSGVSVNCLVIGAVETEMMKKAFPDFKTNITPETITPFIINFTLNQKELFNGKVIPVSSTIP